MNILYLSRQEATRTAWEDPKTIRFIVSSFSSPERSPEILTQAWLSEEGTWNVSIIEKNVSLKAQKDALITVAWIVIDSRSGEIRKRSYFQNIFFGEYLALIKGQPPHLNGFSDKTVRTAGDDPDIHKTSDDISI